MSKEIDVNVSELNTAYNNYLAYHSLKNGGAGKHHDMIASYLRFKKLIGFDHDFIRTEDGDKTFNSESQNYVFNEECANKIKLLASPHYHAMIRGMEINQKPDNETEEIKLIARIEDSL